MMGSTVLSRSTQEAIKVALAISLSISIALWFGWDKPYWAAIAVVVAAANESYSHSVKKGRNRVLGTAFGISYAMFLLALFPQDHLAFITLFTLFLGFCSFMGSHKQFGYAFTIGFNVCAIIACMGSFDSVTTFNIAILRIQETLLGLFVFSVIFSVIWPQKIEDDFFALLALTTKNLKAQLSQLSLGKFERDEELAGQQKTNLSKLKAILDLPLNGSHRLRHERSAWRVIIRAIELLEVLVESPKVARSVDVQDVRDGSSLLTKALSNPMNGRDDLGKWLDQMTVKYAIPKIKYSAFDLPLDKRLGNVVRSLSVLLTGLAIWWYVPIPGAYMMPLVCAIFASVIVSLPSNAIGQTVIGVAGWGTFFLTQYVLILPSFTELWQLAGFYFVNVFLIWKIASKPALALQKVLGVNLLLVMTMSAMYLTPSFSLVVPITMLTVMALALAISAFYMKLYRDL
ncbi:FUSC family protein [Vibrio breoganii]|uniref:FUSC family protein n=1 Tax=Vibrio breoganii TaxID=553239 RepID=UPI000C8345C8|nr:FUSC family protein [Vibrio breoganii]PMH19187.1 hypothetical protein BCU74_06565 [Vibrio breoganii]PMM14242.1 hypothetical protein BCT60_10490 [Vibrio breoganii]TKG21410.1 FUSC family protein [Vibrio breoganii]